MKLLVISGSIRENASTLKVGLHLVGRLKELNVGRAELVDLTLYEYPIWKEVFHHEKNPPPECILLHDHLESADAMIFVTPEYNGGYSLALKNMIDYFGLKVFEKKAIGISAVSTGGNGGLRAALQLQQLVLAIYGNPVPQMLLVPHVQNKFNERGELLENSFDPNVGRFLAEFLWLSQALFEKKQQQEISSLHKTG